MRAIEPSRHPQTSRLRRRARATLVALAFLPPATAPAPAAPADDLAAGERGRVAAVVDGETVRLDGGLAVRLAGLEAPRLALGRRGMRDWPLAGEARAALAALLDGREVALHYDGLRRDRHGRALAHVVRGDGVWIQRALLDAGMARVHGFADNRALLPEMLAAERAARAAGRGIWAHPFYRLRTAATVDADAYSFQLVEDTVVSATVVRGRVYLNFGADWRSDFTITVAPRDRRAFERAWSAAGAATAEALAGRRVRARGWIGRFNGPQLVADHPEQIEILD